MTTSMQSHVYELGLKQGQCSDVKVGAFGRAYSLHRLFLIQSGFFRAMLCGGYAEDIAVSAAASSLAKPPPHHQRSRTPSNLSSSRAAAANAATATAATNDGGDIVSLHFDDPNISRAAFEYCIAHLYGGGPQLVLPYWASPCSAHPLSPAFTIEFGQSQAVGRLDNEAIGPNCHPATPRFLLSLLATSIYLNIPSITSQALTLVLCSLTPYTVSHYLRFAIGKGIEGAMAAAENLNSAASADDQDDAAADWDWELQGPIRTLEDLGKPIAVQQARGGRGRRASDVADEKQGSKGTSSFDEKRPNDSANALDEAELSRRVSDLSLGGGSGSEQRSGPSSAGLKRNRESFGGGGIDDDDDLRSPSLSTRRSSRDTFAGADSQGAGEAPQMSGRAGPRRAPELPDFHYGLPADRIGEACACWLARWGVDVLDAEEVAEQVRSQEMQDRLNDYQRRGDVGRLSVYAGRVLTGEVDLLGPSLLPKGNMPDPDSPLSIPYVRVWSYPAMPSSWVRALISSDSFFVRSEWDRYSFAKRIVEMRRLQKERLASIDAYLWDEQDDDDDLTDAVDTASEANASEHAGLSSPSPPMASFRGFGFNGAFRKQERPESRSDSPFERNTPGRGRRASHSARTTETVEGAGDGDEAEDVEDDDDDEHEYVQLFSSGIYYTHMSFQELNKISCDLSPSTGRPYTPLSVLQAALWAGSELKNHVLSCGKGSRPPSLPTLDGENEAGLDGSWAANRSLESNSGVQVPPSAEGNVDLGVSSGLADFVQACEASGGGGAGRKRGTTPSLLQATFGMDPSMSMQSLGGRGMSPLLTGSSGGSGALLSKRYYLVPSDDTVRLGDGLLAVCGQGHGSSGPGSGEGRPSQHSGDSHGAGRPSSPTASMSLNHSLGATGNAAVQLPNTVPLPAPPPVGDVSAIVVPKKDRRHFFGIANAVASGRELGDKGSRASSNTRKQAGGPLSRLRCNERGETPSLRQYGGLLPEGDEASGLDRPISNDDDEDADAADESGGATSHPSQIERWTGYEPMRLGVEFFGVDLLPEKQRLYSPTFFYAGSIWNLYVQAIRKAKGIQLGIYLHRQNPSESLPQPSALLPLQQPLMSSPPSQETLAGGDFGETDSPSRGPRRSFLLANRFPPGAGHAGGDGLPLDRSSPRPYDSMLGAGHGGSFASGSVGGSGGVGGGGGESSRNSTQLDVSSTPQRRDGASSFLDPGTASNTPHRTGGISLHNTPAGAEMGSTLMLPGGNTLSSLGFSGAGTDNMGASTSTSGGSLRPTSSIYRPSSSASAHLNNGAETAAGGGSGNVPIVALCPGGPAVYQVCPTPSISYRDPRRMLRAYFSIHCPSPFGNALTRFSSAPDYFSLSQSWGWKSSSLLGVAYLEGGKLDEGRSESWGTFRCVCTVGVV